MNQLFDKNIEVYLYDEIGGAPTDIITINDTGMKPNIGIQASFRQNSIVFNPQIRITNFYPSKPLSDYKWIKVIAGYKKSITNASFEGQIFVAYQENPSPDGAILIGCNNANMVDLYNTPITIHLSKGDSFNSVLEKFIQAVTDYSGNQWTIENSLDDRTLIAPMDFNGIVKDFICNLSVQYDFNFLFEGSALIVYEKGKGRTAIDKMTIPYISMPPAQSAAGVTFVAPWMPELRPGMLIYIDPKYFKQTFGATKVDVSSTLECQTIDVQFNTVTNQNSMTVLALNTAESVYAQ